MKRMCLMLTVAMAVAGWATPSSAQSFGNAVVINGTLGIIDLLHAPGSVFAEGSEDARRYQRIDEFAFSSLASKGPPFVPVKV